MPMKRRVIPELPDDARVWDGPTFRRAIDRAGMDIHGLGVALDRHPESIRRWTLERDDPKYSVPHLNLATLVATLLRVRLDELLVTVDRITYERQWRRIGDARRK